MNPNKIKNRWAKRSDTWDISIQIIPETTPKQKNIIVKYRKLLVFLLAALWFILEVCREETILNPIKVPEDIAKLGYTDNVVADQLADAERKIALETKHMLSNPKITLDTHNFSPESSWHVVSQHQLPLVGTDTNIIDITVPSTSFTIRTISRLVRRVLGIPSTYLNGELVYENNRLALTLRTSSMDKTLPALQVFQKNKRMESLIQEGGTALLQLINPSVRAFYAYRVFTDSAKQKKDYKQLVPFLEYCLSYPPATDDVLAIQLWGLTLVHHKRPEEAIKQIQKVIGLNPKLAHAYDGWGLALVRLKKYDEAIKKFQKAIDLDPKFAGAYFNWGWVLGTLNRQKEAITQFQKAICHDSKFAYAYIGLGLALTDLNRPNEAITQFQKAIELDSTLADAYIGLGLALERLEKHDEAINQFKKAIDLDSTLALAYFKWGLALEHLTKYDEAITQFQKTIDLDPKFALAYFKWGWALGNLEKYDEAINQFKKAIKLDSTLADAYNGLGKILNELKRPKEAEEQFRKAQELEIIVCD